MIINYKFTSQSGQEIEGLRTELDRNYDDEEQALVFIENEESQTGGYFELNLRKDEQGRFTGGGYMAEYDSEDDCYPSYINTEIELEVTEHDFDETLKKANEKLQAYGIEIVLEYDEDLWNIGHHKKGDAIEWYTCGDFVEEVGADITECLVHVLARVKNPELVKGKADEMEVLVAYDYEDGSRNNLATMKSSDWTGSKTEAMHKFLLEHYGAWLDGCDDEERDEYLEEIKEAADRLSVGISADCCGDNLYWETVTNI